MRIELTAALLITTMACAGNSGSCPDAGYFYRDTRCSAPLPDAGISCTEVGDGGCFQRCTSDTECSGVGPYCRTLGLFNGGDFSCNDSVRVCRAVDHNDCPVH